MFYSKFRDKCHIVDDVSNIPVKDLQKQDVVILLNEKDPIYTTNMILSDIDCDNTIYEFTANNQCISMQHRKYCYSYEENYEADRNLMYYNGDNLIYLCDARDRYDSYAENCAELKKQVYKNYVAKGKKDIYHNVFTVNGEKEEVMYNNEKVIITYNYIIIPISERYFMVLAKKHHWNETNIVTHSGEIVLICEYTKVNTSNKEQKVMSEWEFLMKIKGYLTNNLFEIINKIGVKYPDNKMFIKFNEILFALGYDLRNYLKDQDRDQNIKLVSKIMSKIYAKSFDLMKYFSPVFENDIPNIKAYLFNRDITITINGKIASYNSGSISDFQGEKIYLGNGKIYKKEVEDYIKDNIELQTYYRIAYSIANFKKEQDGIDPIDGSYYKNGKKQDNIIIYKDDLGIITPNNNYSKEFGYYIKTYDNEKKKDIEERYKVACKLSKK